MKNYIQVIEVMKDNEPKGKIIACAHPAVEKIWQFGSVRTIGDERKMELNTAIVFKDGTRKDFIEDTNSPFSNAESYLQSLD
jgi:hypothetical protein